MLNQHKLISRPQSKIKIRSILDKENKSMINIQTDKIPMKAQEKVFKMTSPVPSETVEQGYYMNSKNSFDMFLDKDKMKKKVFNNMKKMNRNLTKAYLNQCLSQATL